MSYIQIEIKGEKVGLKFGNYAKEQIGRLTGEDPLKGGDSLAKLSHFLFLSKVMYAGYLGNCFVKGIDPALSEQDFTEAVDDMDEAALVGVLNTFNEAVLKLPVPADDKPAKATTAKKKK